MWEEDGEGDGAFEDPDEAIDRVLSPLPRAGDTRAVVREGTVGPGCSRGPIGAVIRSLPLARGLRAPSGDAVRLRRT
ncbi:hypothetical protein QFZ74_001198 [Streptomyces sp. V3I7]|nr:hypothetical protein [Streptomyces sp. V3I7]